MEQIFEVSGRLENRCDRVPPKEQLFRRDKHAKPEY